MILAGSLAVIGKEKSSLKLENLVKPECDRIRGGNCRFFGTSRSFFGLAPTLICNWPIPAVSFTLAEYHASGSGIPFNLRDFGVYKDSTAQDWSQEIEISQSQRLMNLASAEYSEDSELMRSLTLAVESLAKKISLLELSVGE
ncbi:hypothetical protein QUA70_05010 [Microcoleus sp. LAD1_D5]|uniref:hypothetical protein n=1 Tax=unclassified Microcoleus TaxID=2642155 RepID=UPI002FCFBC62